MEARQDTTRWAVLKASSNNEHFHGDADYACVALTPAFARFALSRIALLRGIREHDAAQAERAERALQATLLDRCYSLTYWNYQATFFAWHEAMEDWTDGDGDNVQEACDHGEVALLAADPLADWDERRPRPPHGVHDPGRLRGRHPVGGLRKAH